MLTLHYDDLRFHPLLHACNIWPYLLQNHLLPYYAYHLVSMDKHPSFHLYDVTPIHHLVDHHLLYENWSLPQMDSLEKY